MKGDLERADINLNELTKFRMHCTGITGHIPFTH